LWPEGEPPAGGWPLLLFLHGMGEAAWKEEQGRVTEQGPVAVTALGSPVALYRAKDERVPSLWQKFALVAPQAFNNTGLVGSWNWDQPELARRVGVEVDRVIQTGKVDRTHISATGFSRGGYGCYALDSSEPPLQFRRIASVDAQSLDGLTEVVKRGREVRAYYGPTTRPRIRDAHLAAEKVYGTAKPPVSIIPRPQPGRDYEAHATICASVYAEDELYRWLLA
jgi:hypothetical protein